MSIRNGVTMMRLWISRSATSYTLCDIFLSQCKVALRDPKRMLRFVETVGTY
jgi:hypothetical protein